MAAPVKSEPPIVTEVASNSKLTATLHAIFAVKGELEIVIVTARKKVVTPPTVTTPEGWSLLESNSGAYGTSESEKRRTYVFYRVAPTTGVEAAQTKVTFTASEECDKIYAVCIPIKTETFNTSEPFGANSAWAIKTEIPMKFPAVTVTNRSECLGIAYVGQASGVTKEPGEEWEKISGTTFVGYVWTFPSTKAGTATPTGTGERELNKQSATITLAVNPVPMEMQLLC